MSEPVPFGYRTLFLVPFAMDGETASGIYVQHHKLIPKVYGRVTAVHATCRDVVVGDWVVYLPNRPIRHRYQGGVVWSLDEREVLGVVDPGDHRPFFAPALGPSLVGAA